MTMATSEGLIAARARFWRAWLRWYRVFNNDNASIRATARAMRAYANAKRDLLGEKRQ